MGRRAKLQPPVHVHIKLPAPLVGEISLLLWSDAHGRVPLGKLSEFFELAAREKLQRIRDAVGNLPLETDNGFDERLADTSEGRLVEAEGVGRDADG